MNGREKKQQHYKKRGGSGTIHKQIEKAPQKVFIAKE